MSDKHYDDGPDMPADARARVQARLEATLGFSLDLPDPPPDPAQPPPVDPAPAPPPALSLPTGSGAGRGKLRALLRGRAVTLLLGIGVGVALHAGWTGWEQRQARTLPRSRPVQPVGEMSQAEANAPSAGSTPLAAPTPMPAARPQASRQATPARQKGMEAAPTEDRDRSLAAERALIETARTALARGQARESIGSLGRHARRFPDGQFCQERESLWIQALATEGRAEEARERAQRFRQRFPESALFPVIEDALRSGGSTP